ncbi:MAG: NAD(P)-binding domain-containing protein, partial [Pseudomonadota bacterium]
MSNIGFIGLGIMGTPMALNILKGGHRLYAYSRQPLKAELAEQGAIACRSGQEVAQNADIIIIMVPDTPDVEQVLFAEGGVAQGLAAGKTVVDMSSISPIETKRFA